MKKLLFTVFFLLLLFFSPKIVSAFSCEDFSSDLAPDELEQVSEDCSQKIQDAQNKTKTLNQEITLMNDRVKLTSLKIIQAQNQIKVTEQDIATLSGKILVLNDSLDSLSNVFLSRVVETYKQGKIDQLALLLSSKNLSNFFSNFQYLKKAQQHDRQILITMEQTRVNYDEQKQLKEKLQTQLVDLNKKLQNDQKLLAQQKKDKENLLAVTKNDEKKYQELLSKALAEIASLKGFVQSQKGGILPRQESPDGWFYSQRDERWATQTIGYSQESIINVGCLISDVAMIFTFYGDRKTPSDIAGNPSYFFSRTAYMNSPWPSPAGKSPISVPNMDAVNTELDAGRPVIVHLNLGGDGHFIVLKKRDGSDYIMHDPWNGYDKKFSEFYNLSSIDKRVVYK